MVQIGGAVVGGRKRPRMVAARPSMHTPSPGSADRFPYDRFSHPDYGAIRDVGLEVMLPGDVYQYLRAESARQHHSVNEVLVSVLRDEMEQRTASERERRRLDYAAREQEARAIMRGVD